MSSLLDPEAIEIVPQRHNEYGPGDTSDSASDVLGSDAQESDTSTGTGERSSVESVAPSQTEQDIAPDKIISPAEEAEGN
ncbi:hypothetical protein VVD49_19350 [Uliginosibacterium sp. H3]|uniref:Uncharacterized protein n=1 Tax=Uliginosibacterium silvisoli TaxID=3114758 RepID=A0ABU6KA72_9RHOO|nr:hypothetical protein [Uliginosibacterium sp. H3]